MKILSECWCASISPKLDGDHQSPVALLSEEENEGKGREHVLGSSKGIERK